MVRKAREKSRMQPPKAQKLQMSYEQITIHL